MSVSGNEPTPLVKEFALLLRAVATTVPATGLLYLAAQMLVPDDSDSNHVHNRAVLDMTASLLGFTTDNPELVERVLRNLPDP